jgi:drug/metabolite transporter (DMT)-like permease
MKPNDKLQAHLALLGANLFYGAGFSVAKSVMPQLIQPNAFILIRVLGATALFWMSYFFGKEFQTTIEKKDWIVLAFCGLFGVAINQLMFFQGLQYTTPIHASLMMLSTPILVSLFAIVVLKEKITAWHWFGLLLGISGAYLLISQKTGSSIGSNIPKGDLFVLLNATSYSVYFIMAKPLMAKYRPVIVIRWVFLFGCLYVLPFGFQDLVNTSWEPFHWPQYAAIAFIVIGVTFFTYLWNIYALRVLSPATAGAYIYLQPLFAAIISIIFLNERLNWMKLGAAVLIFTGVYFVGRKKALPELEE